MHVTEPWLRDIVPAAPGEIDPDGVPCEGAPGEAPVPFDAFPKAESTAFFAVSESDCPRLVALVNEALSHRIELPSTDGDGTPVRNGAIWTASIAAEPMDGVVSYHADIFEHGVFVCRIVVSSSLKGEAAKAELNRRLHRWIAAYEERCEKPKWN